MSANEKRLDVKVQAKASGFEATQKKLKDIGAEVRKISGDTGTLGGLGKFAGGLFAVEKINAVMRSGAGAAKAYAEGSITAGEAILKAIDPVPIVGAIDEVAEAVVALGKAFDGTAAKAKEMADREANAVKQAKERAEQTEKLFALLSPSIRDRDTPGEIVTLRKSLTEAENLFSARYGKRPEKPRDVSGDALNKLGGRDFDILVAERELYARRQHLADLEFDHEAKQANKAARAQDGGNFGLLDAGRDLLRRGMAGAGRFDGTAAERISQQYQQNQERRVKAEEEITRAALEQAKAYDDQNSIAAERLKIQAEFLERDRKLRAIASDRTLDPATRLAAGNLRNNLPEDEAAALERLEREQMDRGGRGGPPTLTDSRFLTNVGIPPHAAKLNELAERTAKAAEEARDIARRAEARATTSSSSASRNPWD